MNTSADSVAQYEKHAMSFLVYGFCDECGWVAGPFSGLCKNTVCQCHFSPGLFRSSKWRKEINGTAR